MIRLAVLEIECGFVSSFKYISWASKPQMKSLPDCLLNKQKEYVKRLCSYTCLIPARNVAVKLISGEIEVMEAKKIKEV